MFAKNNVVRYVGKDAPAARGQLFEVAQVGHGKNPKVQLRTIRGGMLTSTVTGGKKPWWVMPEEIELVSVSAPGIGSFNSDSLDVTPKTGHEHESTEPAKCTLKAPEKAPESRMTLVEVMPAPDPQKILDELADEPTDVLHLPSHVWAVWTKHGECEVTELYWDKTDAEARRQSIDELLDMLHIDHDSNCRAVRVR